MCLSSVKQLLLYTGPMILLKPPSAYPVMDQLPVKPNANAADYSRLRHMWHSVPTHWGQGGLETGDYMLGTFRAHVHLSHNVTSG